MFEALGFTKEAAHEQFGFLLDAFKYGVPPHAGLAYGLDRLVMLMAKVDSIGTPASRYAGREIKPPPPAIESTNPARNTNGHTIKNV